MPIASRAIWTRREQFVEGILTRFPVVEFGVGATAIAMDFQVATVNVRDFRRVPGLRVQIWGH